jgi:hypothetical protein
MEKTPLELGCPTPSGEHVIFAEGAGYGATRAAALTAARAEADGKLSIGVKCAAGCRLEISETEPVYDSSVPTYFAWGSGFESRVQRSKAVKAACISVESP